LEFACASEFKASKIDDSFDKDCKHRGALELALFREATSKAHICTHMVIKSATLEKNTLVATQL
jgi:hypothetical protein